MSDERGCFDRCRACNGDGEVSSPNENLPPVGCEECRSTGMVLDSNAKRQLADVRRRWATSTLEMLDKHRILLRVPDVDLPNKYWEQSSTTILVEIPIGFPCASPQHFYCEKKITLKSGGWPAHSMSPKFRDFFGVKAEQWHMLVLRDWNPNKCTLMTYVNTCRQRFQIAR